jgi:hypothetical protein
LNLLENIHILELPLLFLEILQMLKLIYTKRIKGLLFMNISMYKGYLPSLPITAMLDARLETSSKN